MTVTWCLLVHPLSNKKKNTSSISISNFTTKNFCYCVFNYVSWFKSLCNWINQIKIPNPYLMKIILALQGKKQRWRRREGSGARRRATTPTTSSHRSPTRSTAAGWHFGTLSSQHVIDSCLQCCPGVHCDHGPGFGKSDNYDEATVVLLPQPL